MSDADDRLTKAVDGAIAVSEDVRQMVEALTPSPPVPDDAAIDVAVNVWIGKRQLAAMEAPQAAALMASLQDLFIVLDRIAKIEKGEIPA